jgi:hypothetical protein
LATISADLEANALSPIVGLRSRGSHTDQKNELTFTNLTEAGLDHMHIARVQIEEGFLDGLDLHLVPGLNVLIGARGTGKTSIIELIRFCLGVTGYTSESAKRSRDHALSILGSGQVTVTLVAGSEEITVTRTADDPEPRASSSFTKPIVFSQTEIESVGLQPRGRLQLLDSSLEIVANQKPTRKKRLL